MKKTIILPIIFLFGLLFFVNAGIDCNFTSPTYITNGTVLNVSYNTTGMTSIINITVAFEAKSASTRNSSYSLIGNVTNTSNQRHVNFTMPSSTAVLEDSNDYVVRASCILNASGATSHNGVSSESSAVILDRTNPAPPTGITFTNPVTDTKTITATINLELANACIIKFGGNRISMTRSSTTCTYTAQRGKSSPADGDYQFSVIASDGTNETASGEQSVTIDADQNGDGGWLGGGLQYTPSANQGLQGALGGGSSNPFAPKPTGLKSIPPIGWVIIAIVAVMLFGNQKK